jgi:cytochrome c nitrite reductase small subunit
MATRPSTAVRLQRFATSAAGAAAAAAVIGLTIGIGGFTFAYGRGASYLTDDPAACANCHVMQSQYDGWLQGSHRAAASCNDCHTPKGLVGKYATKARNGFWHSFAFSTGRFAEPIRIRPGNLSITESRCRGCHQEIASAVDGPDGIEPRFCIQCHRTTGHRG